MVVEVRDGGPWEINVQVLIAVVLDVERIRRNVERGYKGIESESDDESG